MIATDGTDYSSAVDERVETFVEWGMPYADAVMAASSEASKEQVKWALRHGCPSELIARIYAVAC